MENFFERIDVNASLKEISRLICSKCGLDSYISSQIIEVGYEDFNFIIETKQLMRLRYVISKMALRVKRYSYDKSEFLSKLINNGKKHLAELIDYFDLSDEKDIEEK